MPTPRLAAQFESPSYPAAARGHAEAVRRHLAKLLELLPQGHPRRPGLLAALEEVKRLMAGAD